VSRKPRLKVVLHQPQALTPKQRACVAVMHAQPHPWLSHAQVISNLFGAALECSPPANADSRSFPAAMQSAAVKGRRPSGGGAGQLAKNADPCNTDVLVPDSSRSLRKVRLRAVQAPVVLCSHVQATLVTLILHGAQVSQHN
jgi:hypothetical protein